MHAAVNRRSLTCRLSYDTSYYMKQSVGFLADVIDHICLVVSENLGILGDFIRTKFNLDRLTSVWLFERLDISPVINDADFPS